MIAFVAVSVVLLVAALAIVLWPLLRREKTAAVARQSSNLDILRDQVAELDRDLESGALGAERYAQARAELEGRVLEEAAVPGPVAPVRASGRIAAVAVAILIPVTSVLLYLHLGSLQGIAAARHPAADLSSITPDQFQDMTAKLAARMQQNPDDGQGWTMLGRAYRAMNQFGEANDAFGKAVKLRPQDADLLADYAESLALARGRALEGEPTRLLDRARMLEPRNTKVLTLSGSAAYERKDYRRAIEYWETVLKQPGVGGELAQALQAGIAESKSHLAGKPAATASAGKERLSGEVSLADALRGKVRPDDAVFVFARAASGPRMPLAIVKIKVADLPYKFAFDDSMAMMPDMTLSRFAEVVVGARVSRSGSATPQAGDLEGSSAKVAPGRDGVHVTIDRAVASP